MKKFLALMLAMMLAFCMVACGDDEEDEPMTGMPNPVTELVSLAELEEATGMQFVRPAVMGCEDVSFCSIDCGDYILGDYDFTVNGIEYTLRASTYTDEDISGCYVEDGTAFEGNTDEIAYYSDDEAKLARWYNMDGQYVLYVYDNGEMDDETFKGIVDEMVSMTTEVLSADALHEIYTSLAGEYQDSYSGRAYMDVVVTTDDAGNECLEISVMWGNSASDSMLWTMTATAAEDGSLNYSDGVSADVVTNEDGSEDTAVLGENEVGFFAVTDGTIAWVGAPDETCRDCVFVKIN